jgi:hypothetical protein
MIWQSIHDLIGLFVDNRTEGYTLPSFHVEAWVSVALKRYFTLNTFTNVQHYCSRSFF